MLIEIKNTDPQMKLVYDHKRYLNEYPDIMESVQILTKDSARPSAGLSGSKGLYGSPNWWMNIHNGAMPLKFVKGVILKIYSPIDENFIAQGGSIDDVDIVFDLLTDDGLTVLESAYSNNLVDYLLFQVGAKVEYVYVLDELKLQPAQNGGVNYNSQILEMAVSI